MKKIKTFIVCELIVALSAFAHAVSIDQQFDDIIFTVLRKAQFLQFIASLSENNELQKAVSSLDISVLSKEFKQRVAVENGDRCVPYEKARLAILPLADQREFLEKLSKEKLDLDEGITGFQRLIDKIKSDYTSEELENQLDEVFKEEMKNLKYFIKDNQTVWDKAKSVTEKPKQRWRADVKLSLVAINQCLSIEEKDEGCIDIMLSNDTEAFLKEEWNKSEKDEDIFFDGYLKAAREMDKFHGSRIPEKLSEADIAESSAKLFYETAESGYLSMAQLHGVMGEAIAETERKLGEINDRIAHRAARGRCVGSLRREQRELEEKLRHEQNEFSKHLVVKIAYEAAKENKAKEWREKKELKGQLEEDLKKLKETKEKMDAYERKWDEARQESANLKEMSQKLSKQVADFEQKQESNNFQEILQKLLMHIVAIEQAEQESANIKEMLQRFSKQIDDIEQVDEDVPTNDQSTGKTKEYSEEWAY